ncbi:MAG TPA: hypothetical protein VJ991_12930 [Balneolales bacterium]|nr:hypothetical protein [Balneolales bacterium]
MKKIGTKFILSFGMITLLSIILLFQACDTVGSKSGMLNVISNDTGSTSNSYTKEKTYAYSWKPVDASYSNILHFLWMPNDASDATIQQDVQYTNSLPEGHRVIYIDHSIYKGIRSNPLDKCVDPATGNLTQYWSIWWDHGVQSSKNRIDQLFSKYAAAGGKVDYIVMDTEYWLNNWVLSSNSNYSYSAIQNDPRFQKLVPELGFSDLNTVKNYATSKNYLIWNDIMKERTAQYIDQTVYDVVKKYYPSVKGVDYKYSNYNQNYQMIEKNGHDMDYYGNGAVVGTDQNWNLYGEFGSVRNKKLDGQNLYTNTPFNSFRLDVNMMRAMKLASSNPVSPWIGPRSYGSADYSPISNNDYYQEMVLHVLLTGPKHVLFFNDPEFAKTGDNKILDETIKEFDSIAGYKDKKTLVNKEAWWGDDYVLTGMDAGGNKVWRFTPDLDLSSNASSTIVQKSGPVIVQTAKTKITFPQGSIYTPSNSVSTKGIWITQPDGAQAPIIENL